MEESKNRRLEDWKNGGIQKRRNREMPQLKNCEKLKKYGGRTEEWKNAKMEEWKNGKMEESKNRRMAESRNQGIEECRNRGTEEWKNCDELRN